MTRGVAVVLVLAGAGLAAAADLAFGLIVTSVGIAGLADELRRRRRR